MKIWIILKYCLAKLLRQCRKTFNSFIISSTLHLSFSKPLKNDIELNWIKEWNNLVSPIPGVSIRLTRHFKGGQLTIYGFGFCVAEFIPERFSLVYSSPLFEGLKVIGIILPSPEGISKLHGIKISGSSIQLH